MSNKKSKARENIFKETCKEKKCMQKPDPKPYITRKYGKKHLGGHVG